MKKSLVIKHLAFEDLGTIEKYLAQNFETQIFEAGYDEITTEKLHKLSPDLLIILGGPIGVYDDADFPFLNDEIQYLQHRIEHNLPTLGICLGAQLIAAAANAKVYPGDKKEMGWSALMLSDAGLNSPLSLLNEDVKVLHWHADTFELPQQATLLASTALYQNQAFSIGNVIGLQFHPEVTEKAMEKWFIGHFGEINNTLDIDVKRLRFDTHKYAPKLEKIASHFWKNFFNSIGC